MEVRKTVSFAETIDVPLGHKDDAWSFDHFDAMTVCVPDASRRDEIMMVVLADAARVCLPMALEMTESM